MTTPPFSPPPLEHVPPADPDTTTVRGEKLVQSIANDALSWSDVNRIRLTAVFRYAGGWLNETEANARLRQLETEIAKMTDTVAGIKRQKHESDLRAAAAEAELAVLREHFGSEIKPNISTQ